MDMGLLKILYIVGLSMIGTIVQSEDYLLPSNIKPILYRLDKTIHLEDEFKFEGTVNISFLCLNATNTIILHSDSLDVDSKNVVIVHKGGKVVPVNNVILDPKTTRMHVKTAEILTPCNEYALTIKFSGNNTDELVTYIDKETNQTKSLVVTQYEPIGARKSFPCFDEPRFKAKFVLSLAHNKKLTSISNTKLIRTTPMSSNVDYVIDEFEETVLMSTYLVAYMVSDFVTVESDNHDNEVKFRIIVRKDAVNQTENAKKTVPLFLKYYKKYFNKSFPLSKIDLAAIPNFNYGEMENLGLATFDERSLLADPVSSTPDAIWIINNVVGSTIALQWFGDLVTTTLWDSFWVYEAYTSYLTERVVDDLHFEKDNFQMDIFKNFYYSMRDNSYRTSTPISKPIVNQDDIPKAIDSVNYQLSFSVFYMLNMFLGEEAFHQGIQKFVKIYEFSNANDDDLWCILTEEAYRAGSLNTSMSVNEIMHTWTKQAGYPIVMVNRDYLSHTATLSQKRYLSDKSKNDENSSTWLIPITKTTSIEADFNQTKPSLWLTSKNNLTISLNKEAKWVILNLQLVGLYRVQYDNRNWMEIISTLNNAKTFKQIHLLNRAQLILDALSFSMIDELDYKVSFNLLNYLKHEDEFSPWESAFNSLNAIDGLLKRTPNFQILQNFMQKLMAPIYTRFRDMKTVPTDYKEQTFKYVLNYHACHYSVKYCVNQSISIFREWMHSSDPDSFYTKIPINFVSIITCTAIKNSGVDEWNFLWARFLNSNVEWFKQVYLSALSCSENLWLLNRYLNWTLGQNPTISLEYAYSQVFYNVAWSSDAGYCAAKNFVYTRISDIYNQFNKNSDDVVQYVDAIGYQMKTEEELDEFQKFIIKSSAYLHGTDSATEHTIEIIKSNIVWMKKYYNKISDYLV